VGEETGPSLNARWARIRPRTESALTLEEPQALRQSEPNAATGATSGRMAAVRDTVTVAVEFCSGRDLTGVRCSVQVAVACARRDVLIVGDAVAVTVPLSDPERVNVLLAVVRRGKDEVGTEGVGDEVNVVAETTALGPAKMAVEVRRHHQWNRPGPSAVG
jgi:hypothetical protein